MFLKVKNGKTLQEFKKQKTFGANIHELISSNFFFKEEVYIGEFARNKINSIINEINDSKKIKLTKKRFDYLNDFISTIDERIIRTKLREMLFEIEEDKELDWIDEEMKYLENLKSGIHK